MNIKYLIGVVMLGLAGVTMLFFPLVCDAANLSPNSVLTHATQYNDETIQVSGIVEDFELRESHRGNVYETFKLCGKTDCLNVFAWGQTLHNDGDSITLSGVFYQVKHVGRYTFYNELDVGG